MTPAKPLPPGHARLSVGLAGGESSITDLSSVAPLRLLSEHDRGDCVRVRMASFGGGLVAGDRADLDVTVGADARLFLGSAAPSKVFGAKPPKPTEFRLIAKVGPGGVFVFVLWPTALFADASYVQLVHAALADGASACLVDVQTSGREARGERWDIAKLDVTLELATPKRRVLRDRLILDAGVSPVRPRLGEHRALGAVILVGPLFRELATHLKAAIDAKPVNPRAPFFVTASPMLDGCFLRLAADDPERLEHFLADALARPLAALTGADPWRQRTA